jgi:hypothetical protein
LQSWGGSNDLFEHRGFVDLFTHSDVFAPKPVFRPLAILNVGAGSIPSHDLPLVVAYRIVASQKPTITSVPFAHTQLQLESGATGASTIGISARRTFPVIRMNKRPGRKKIPGCLPPLIKSSAEVIEQDAVSVKTFAVGTEYPGKLRREVQHLPEVRFATLQLLVQLFLLSHVHRSANDPLQNPVLDNRHTD